MLARAREQGLDPADLRELGRREAVPEFVAAGLFLEQYLQVLGFSNAFDYADLIARGRQLADEHRDDLRRRFSHVFVDEYQDTDPAQVDLLRSLAGDGRDLVVVGDPDQSIYGFRGADLRGILDFPAAFPTRDGAPAPVVALRHDAPLRPPTAAAPRGRSPRRSGSPASIPAEQFRAFRNPTSDAPGLGDGRVEVLTFDTARAETEHVADLLRRAHLEDGIGWSEMAVLVRSGRTSIPALRRSLTGAGVPVEVASDETPLVREPAVLPLLAALRVVVDLDVDDPADPDFVGRRPGGGAADLAARRARRPRPAGAGPGAAHAATPTYPRRELATPCASPLDPGSSTACAASSADRARRIVALVRAARAGARRRRERRAGALDALGRHRLGSAARAARPSRAVSPRRLAHRDLDAICALFEAAARSEEQAGPRRAAGVPRHPLRPGDPGRHARRPRSARRGGPAADRPSRQGPGVAAGRRRARPGRRVARPAPPRLAARCRPHRSRPPACRR